jgi:hypothetical protein
LVNEAVLKTLNPFYISSRILRIVPLLDMLVEDRALLRQVHMLEIRPVCENCGTALPNESDEAMICTFECTFCAGCVENILRNVCPNCGGGFEKRPTRPSGSINRFPKADPLVRPIDQEKFKLLRDKFQYVEPRKR